MNNKKFEIINDAGIIRFLKNEFVLASIYQYTYRKSKFVIFKSAFDTKNEYSIKCDLSDLLEILEIYQKDYQCDYELEIF